MDVNKVVRLMKKNELKENSGIDGSGDFCEALEELVSDAPRQTQEEMKKTKEKTMPSYLLFPRRTRECGSWTLSTKPIQLLQR